MRGLAKEAAKRFPSAREMAAAFGIAIAPATRAGSQTPQALVMTHIATNRQVVFTAESVLNRAALDPGDAAMSRRHGRIEPRIGAWWIGELSDAPSANGIYVNSLRVADAEQRVLKTGDEVRLGQSVWTIAIQARQ